MFCQSCGSKLSKTAKFCMDCGAKVEKTGGSSGGRSSLKDSVVSNSSVGQASVGSIHFGGGKTERRCLVCDNSIERDNKALICLSCGTKFCETCEKWYRVDRTPGEKPLCNNCYEKKSEKIQSESSLKQKDFEKLKDNNEKKDKGSKQTTEPQKTFTNSIGIKFVLIPAGEFDMGLETSDDMWGPVGPVHRVKISKPFYLGQYPVTQNQWKQLMNEIGRAHV